jgi:multimeric flavodoxin WrbA
MKITVINGSPRGEYGNTDTMVRHLLAGAGARGAETRDILLAEKNIRHCRGCHACWSAHPGRCIIDDDMAYVLSTVAGSDVIALATPVYFENISGMLKAFMDRLTVTGGPHSQNRSGQKPAALMMVSSCGLPDRTQFDVISHWIDRVALKMNTEVIAKIYATQGKFLASVCGETNPLVAAYLRKLEQAGREIAETMKLSPEIERALAQGFTAE